MCAFQERTFSQPEGTPPPAQLELSVTRETEFVICDYTIETLFSDKKSRGFHIHKSHLSDPKRVSRLLMATSLAYIWIVYLGILVIQQGQTDLIDRSDRRDKSLFRLGLDWLTNRLKFSKPFPVQFHVPPVFALAGLESVR